MSPSSLDNSTAMEQTNNILCARHFHQVFWLPESELHGRLRITYATTSNFVDKNLPVVLICAPMFGGRWYGMRSPDNNEEVTLIRPIASQDDNASRSTCTIKWSSCRVF